MCTRRPHRQQPAQPGGIEMAFVARTKNTLFVDGETRPEVKRTRIAYAKGVYGKVYEYEYYY